jgi:hypothetical protein
MTVMVVMMMMMSLAGVNVVYLLASSADNVEHTGIAIFCFFDCVVQCQWLSTLLTSRQTFRQHRKLHDPAAVFPLSVTLRRSRSRC